MSASAETANALALDNASLCISGDEAFIDVMLTGGSVDIEEGVGGLVEACFTITTPMAPNSGFGVELFSVQNGVAARIGMSASGQILATVEAEGNGIGVVESETDITTAMTGVTSVRVQLDATSGSGAVARLDFNCDDSFELLLPGSATLLNNTSYWGGLFADTCGIWCDEGHGLAGINGEPALDAEGALTPGSAGFLELGSAAPNKPAVLFVAFAGAGAPFKCGTLVPTPIASQYSLFTNMGGAIKISWANWPASLTAISIYFQYAIKDSAAICGASLSNALRADVP